MCVILPLIVRASDRAMRSCAARLYAVQEKYGGKDGRLMLSASKHTALCGGRLPKYTNRQKPKWKRTL